MERKSLYDISWKVDEPTYRADPALSYSTLARYEREGFNNIDKLFDKIETPSLVFGSAVDALITGGQEEFDKGFMVAEFPPVPDSIVTIVKELFQWCHSTNRTLESIEDDFVIETASKYNYQPNWKPETRAKVIKEKGAEYYKLLYVAGDKTVLNTGTYQDVCNAVKALKESKATRFYFAENNPFDDIERFYQLKFRGSNNGIDYRIMSDLLVVDHKNKTVTPCDLKTSGKPEWDFHKSFLEWRYSIQARLYWRIIKQNLEKDDYFKNFTLRDYLFIVVNRKSLTPLVWEFSDTSSTGELRYGRLEEIVMRDPYVIGNELNTYLKHRPQVPAEINLQTPNSLTYWLNKLGI